MAGWWSGAMGPASVDWCEPNHTLTAWVAEPFNTVSSLYIAGLGAWGLWRWWGSDVMAERRFAWAFAGMVVVGIGSAAFHGTLTRGAQALDELPMVWLGLIGVWIVNRRTAPRAGIDGQGWWMTVYAIAFTAAYLWAEAWFELFIATYAALVGWTVIASTRHTFLQPSTPAMRRLLVAASLTYLGGLSLFWIPEHLLLACDHPLQALQLHSWWHVGAGTGTYLWLMWAVADRRFVEGRELTMVKGWPPELA